MRGAFSRRHMLDDDFEVIPTPGHTPGATAYLWDNGNHRFLFTGDTIYLRDGEWVDGLLGSSDRASYVESLSSSASWTSTCWCRGRPPAAGPTSR